MPLAEQIRDVLSDCIAGPSPLRSPHSDFRSPRWPAMMERSLSPRQTPSVTLWLVTRPSRWATSWAFRRHGRDGILARSRISSHQPLFGPIRWHLRPPRGREVLRHHRSRSVLRDPQPRLEPPSIAAAHSGTSAPPPVPCRFRDLRMTKRISQITPRSEHPLALEDRLLRSMPSPPNPDDHVTLEDSDPRHAASNHGTISPGQSAFIELNRTRRFKRCHLNQL